MAGSAGNTAPTDCMHASGRNWLSVLKFCTTLVIVAVGADGSGHTMIGSTQVHSILRTVMVAYCGLMMTSVVLSVEWTAGTPPAGNKLIPYLLCEVDLLQRVLCLSLDRPVSSLLSWTAEHTMIPVVLGGVVTVLTWYFFLNVCSSGSYVEKCFLSLLASMVSPAFSWRVLRCCMR